MSLTEATLDAERYITEATFEAVDKVLEAIGAATVGELLNKLVDLAQAKLITEAGHGRTLLVQVPQWT